MRKVLLGSGILASVVYVAANVIVPMQWDAYHWMSQTVSELSAIGAPTRRLWIALVAPYTLLLIAFGTGVRRSAGPSRALKIAGALIVADAVVGVTWPPMHLREVLAAGGATFTDTMHIAYTVVHVVLVVGAIGFCAAAFDRRYRAFSLLMVATMMGFGVLTGMDAPEMQANLPTPMIGVWERISMLAFLVWCIVTATALMRRTVSAETRAA